MVARRTWRAIRRFGRRAWSGPTEETADEVASGVELTVGRGTIRRVGASVPSRKDGSPSKATIWATGPSLGERTRVDPAHLAADGTVVWNDEWDVGATYYFKHVESERGFDEAGYFRVEADGLVHRYRARQVAKGDDSSSGCVGDGCTSFDGCGCVGDLLGAMFDGLDILGGL